MPALKGADLSTGPWINRARKRPKYSPFACPVCGFWLHEYLVETGERVHPLCLDLALIDPPLDDDP